MIDLGKVAGGLLDPLDSQMNIVLRWFENPVGDPPMVDIPQALLLPTSHDLRWKKRPLVWPASLLARPLVLVSASGGIDSTAAALEARRRWPKAMILLERSDTGREPADSEAVLQRLSRAIQAPVVTLLARNELFDLIRWRGMIPNRWKGSWCTLELKGSWLDRFNHYLTIRRRPNSSIHTVGFLWGEGPEVRSIRKPLGKRGGRDRVTGHVKLQASRFGRQLREVVVLHDARIDKDGETIDPRVPKKLRARGSAIEMIRRAGLPISRVYLDRTRHGCVPCKWWSDERLWISYYHLDPEGFEQAAQIEDEVARVGAANPRSPNHRNPVPIALRTWLLPTVKNATVDDGYTLREWLRIWQRQGKLDSPPDMGLVRVEDLGEVDSAHEMVHLPGYREGRR